MRWLAKSIRTRNGKTSTNCHRHFDVSILNKKNRLPASWRSLFFFLYQQWSGQINANLWQSMVKYKAFFSCLVLQHSHNVHRIICNFSLASYFSTFGFGRSFATIRLCFFFRRRSCDIIKYLLQFRSKMQQMKTTFRFSFVFSVLPLA